MTVLLLLTSFLLPNISGQDTTSSAGEPSATSPTPADDTPHETATWGTNRTGPGGQTSAAANDTPPYSEAPPLATGTTDAQLDQPAIFEITLPDPQDNLTMPRWKFPITIKNLGAASTPAEATLTSNREHRGTAFRIPSIPPGETYHLDHTVTVNPGINTWTLDVDEVQVSPNGLDRTWAIRTALGDENRQPIRFEDGQGRPVRVNPNVTETGTAVTIRAELPTAGTIHVEAGWLDSRIPGANTQGRLWTSVTRGNTTEYRIAHGGGVQEFVFAQSFVATNRTFFGMGNPERAFFPERPMNATLLGTPINQTEQRTLHTRNGTLSYSENVTNANLTVDLSDENTGGQWVWYSKAWLADLGFRNPRFAYADGTRLEPTITSGYYVIKPPHFTVIHTFSGTLDPFKTVNAQGYSDVYRSASQYVYLKSDRGDTSDESFIRNFVPPSEFTVEARVYVQAQGNWQGAYPLVIGNRADREAPGSNPYHAPRSFGFFYYSQDQYSGSSFPRFDAYYADSNGAKQTVWSWHGNENAPSAKSGFTVTLRMRVTATDTYFELVDQSGAQDRSVSRSNALIPLGAVNSIFVGSESLDSNGPEPASVLQVDDIKVSTTRGNAVNDDFVGNANNWQRTGSASWVSGDVLQLTPNTGGSVGRAVSNTPLSSSRFSLEFALKIGPDANGGGADGLAFMFYKDTNYVPAPGGEVGFNDGISGDGGHKGYGIKFDTYPNAGEPISSIAYVKDNVGNKLSSTAYTFEDNQWHQVTVDVWDNDVFVYIDQSFAFGQQYPVIMRDSQAYIQRVFSNWGFSAATGGLSSYHWIDSVHLSTVDAQPCLNAADLDTDGLGVCREEYLGTSSSNPDTDNDGVGSNKETGKGSDFFESPFWNSRDIAFCGSSLCDYPNPNKKDIYIETDWMQKTGTGGYSMQPTAAQTAPVVTAFATRGIKAHFDDGTYGGGNLVPVYDQSIRFDARNSGADLDFYDYKNGGDAITQAQFKPERYRIFHYMLFGYQYDESPTSSGRAFISDDDVFVSYGLIKETFGLADFDKGISGTIIHELGHNLCLSSAGASPADCNFAYIDNWGPSTYQSAMNYNYQMTFVDYSTGWQGTGDHNDWAAIRPQDLGSWSDPL